ncbi:Senescence/dehydration-associated protein, chloroplastic-like protein [Drosera capensis]
MSPEPISPPPSITSSLDDPSPLSPETTPSSSEQVLITLPSTTVHLIDSTRSVPLASGTLEIIRLIQNNTIVAVLARIGDQIQWPIAKDEPVVRLDDSHYFFSLRVPNGMNNNGSDEIWESDTTVLNYGVTMMGSDECLVEAFDRTLDVHGCFSVGSAEGVDEGWLREDEAVAYWVTVAPNVGEYSGSVARMIATGSGQLVKGTVTGLCVVLVNETGGFWIAIRVEKVTKMTEQVAAEVPSGVVKVTGYITSSIVNSEVGKKFFSLLPGEIILASLDAFTSLLLMFIFFVLRRYGDKAAKATNSGLGAAGHAIGTAWAIFKIRKAINPKSVLKPTALARAAAEGGSLNA